MIVLNVGLLLLAAWTLYYLTVTCDRFERFFDRRAVFFENTDGCLAWWTATELAEQTLRERCWLTSQQHHDLSIALAVRRG